MWLQSSISIDLCLDVGQSYVIQDLHDSEFIVDLVVEHTILHELAFLDLFHGEHLALSLCSELKDVGESSLADVVHNVIFLATIPFCTTIEGRASRSQHSGTVPLEWCVWVAVLLSLL